MSLEGNIILSFIIFIIIPFNIQFFIFRKSIPKIVKVNRFHELLEDEELYQAFNKFLSNEQSQENLHFYRHAMELEKCTNSKESKTLAKQIALEYLGIPGNDQKLSLPLHYISEIEKLLNREDRINNKIFLEARMDVESLLRTKYLTFCEE